MLNCDSTRVHHSRGRFESNIRNYQRVLDPFFEFLWPCVWVKCVSGLGGARKKISIATGLSKETHQIVSSLGSPILDARKALPPGDLRQNLLRVAEQTMMQYENVTLETHERLFDVQIEAL